MHLLQGAFSAMSQQQIAYQQAAFAKQAYTQQGFMQGHPQQMPPQIQQQMQYQHQFQKQQVNTFHGQGLLAGSQMHIQMPMGGQMPSMMQQNAGFGGQFSMGSMQRQHMMRQPQEQPPSMW